MYCTFLFSHSKDIENEIYTQSTYMCNPWIYDVTIGIKLQADFPKNVVKHARVRAPVVSYEQGGATLALQKT